MKALILGSGWIGNRLKEYLGDSAWIFQSRLEDFYGSRPEEREYDVVINTAAKTNIDWCEKNKGKSLFINALEAARIAAICYDEGVKYVFFSSGCIFESNDVNDEKFEDSIPNPQCWYAQTKVLAEELILEDNPNALILRPRLPLSEIPHPRNTINKLLSYDILNNAQESVTVVEDMLPIVKDLIQLKAIGIFHLINEGTISPEEIGRCFNHKFVTCSKKDQDERIQKEGRAKRVTTYLGSKRIPLLPNIKERIKTLAERYNAQRNFS